MKKILSLILTIGIIFIVGCSLKNNSVVDNDDSSDVAPDTSPETNYQTLKCKKDNTNTGVQDNTIYTIKHNGDEIKTITMEMDYKLNETSGKDFFDENKSIFDNLTDKFKDVIGITTNVIEDSTDMFKAQINLEMSKISDEDMSGFDKIKISRSLKKQKEEFEKENIKCN